MKPCRRLSLSGFLGTKGARNTENVPHAKRPHIIPIVGVLRVVARVYAECGHRLETQAQSATPNEGMASFADHSNAGKKRLTQKPSSKHSLSEPVPCVCDIRGCSIGAG